MFLFFIFSHRYLKCSFDVWWIFPYSPVKINTKTRIVDIIRFLFAFLPTFLDVYLNIFFYSFQPTFLVFQRSKFDSLAFVRLFSIDETLLDRKSSGFCWKRNSRSTIITLLWIFLVELVVTDQKTISFCSSLHSFEILFLESTISSVKSPLDFYFQSIHFVFLLSFDYEGLNTTETPRQWNSMIRKIPRETQSIRFMIAAFIQDPDGLSLADNLKLNIIKIWLVFFFSIE